MKQRTIDAINEERQAQDDKWGTSQHDDSTWLAILVEEVGEASKEVLCGGSRNRAAELRDELIQVAAVAIAWLEQIDQ